MYYGWKIVGATFVTWFISVGFLFYSYGTFFLALEKDFGESRFAISLGLACMNIAMGLLAPFLGRAVDQWSIRRIMLIGAACMTAGFLVASQVTALGQFILLMGTLLGVGASMMGQLPNLTLVSNWFIRRRGMALGIATMGVSMSGMVMPPVTMWLILNFGWRTTFVVFGCLSSIVVMPLVGLIVVNRPEEMGLHPDGASEEDASLLADSAEVGPLRDSAPISGGRKPSPEFSVATTIRDREFWTITITIALTFFAMSAVLTHMIPHAKDLGISELRAPFVLSACAGAGVFGKILFGYIADFLDARFALLLSMGFQFCGTFLLLIAESYPTLILVGTIFGLGMGGILPLWGALVGEYFGRQSFGRVMGLMGPCMLPIQVCGVPFAGLVHDLTGEYTIAYRTDLVLILLASVVLLTLRRPAASRGDVPVRAK
ncbi:MAG: MFS transporter [Candidatus Hydrogenedentes bacterium]|nr:MFS transporter [Candidatus Hydrogenedentota bacterium]